MSRLFLGMNLHCAQCHDHPLVDAFKQDHYYGLQAFLSRSYVFTDKATKVSIYAEKAEGDVTFQSVFVPKVTKNATPQIPFGKAILEPKFEKGQEYVKPVPKGERGIPKFSRRAQLAEQVDGGRQRDGEDGPQATDQVLLQAAPPRGTRLCLRARPINLRLGRPAPAPAAGPPCHQGRQQRQEQAHQQHRQRQRRRRDRRRHLRRRVRHVDQQHGS